MKYFSLRKSKRSLINGSVTLAILLGLQQLVPFSNQNLNNYNLNLAAIAADATEIPAEAQQLLGKWQLATSFKDADSFVFLFAPDGKLYLINSTKQTATKGEYQITNVNGQIYLDIYQSSFGARTTFSFNSKGQLLIQQLFLPAIMQFMYSSSMSDPNIIGGIFMPNILSLTKISSDTTLDPKIDFPDFQSPANKARQSEAKTYIGTMNRAQQAYFLENGKFTNSLDELAIGITSETDSYEYFITVIDAKKAVQQFALPKKDNLKAYAGLVYIAKPSNNSLEATSSGLLCESAKPTNQPPKPFQVTAKPTCPEGYVNIGR